MIIIGTKSFRNYEQDKHRTQSTESLGSYFHSQLTGAWIKNEIPAIHYCHVGCGQMRWQKTFGFFGLNLTLE